MPSAVEYPSFRSFPYFNAYAGAGGFPPRRHRRAAPPTRGAAAPLVNPPALCT